MVLAAPAALAGRTGSVRPAVPGVMGASRVRYARLARSIRIAGLRTARAEARHCIPAAVTVDNEREARATVLEVEVQDYPGLLGVLAWVLNGLDVMARDAVVRTTADGVAHNCFWLTSRSGKKLKDATAAMLADRVRDYISYCTPPPEAETAQEWRAGPVRVSNLQHPRHTLVTVQEALPKPGQLLEIASVLSGYNANVQEGVIAAADPDTAENSREEPGRPPRRVHRFWITNADGAKLTREQATGLLFTLNLVLSPKGQPLRPPDQLLWAVASPPDCVSADSAGVAKGDQDPDLVEAHDAFDRPIQPQ